MRLLKPLLSFFIALSIISCSSSDDSSSNTNVPFNLPLSDGNFWTYDVVGQNGNSRDSLYVANDTLINGKTYKKFKTEQLPSGFYSSSLNNNGVIYENGKLLLTGDLDLASGQALPVNLDLSVIDFVIFDKNANNGAALNSNPKTGNIQQTYNGIPLNINYDLNTYAGETLQSFTSPDGTTYNNVKVTQVKLNMTISATYAGVTIPNILTNPQVMVSTVYTADGIGMVYTNTDITVNLNSLVATQLGVDPNSTQNQQEFLDTYQVN